MDLQPGIQVTDNVVLVRLIGEGAMGSVWVGQHQGLNTEVAVKFIHEELTQGRHDAIERFRREARAAAQIKTPHVVQMFDHGVMDDGTPYIVMELLDGESLHERLERGGWLSPEETLTMLTHVGRALTAAHARGVIHRDIKPHNIWLSEVHGERLCKVLDFGIAKQKTRMSMELTEPGTIVGTPQYVSRDLIMYGDAKTVDDQVDLWSMCVVAYKCLTTTLPFDGDSIGKICAALASGDFEPPSKHRPELGTRFDAWFERAFDTAVENRFANAQELVATFRAVVAGQELAPVARKTVPDRAPPPRSAWRGSLMAIVVVGSLGAGAVIGVAFFQPPAATTPPVAPVTPSAPASESPSADTTSEQLVTTSASVTPSASVAESPPDPPGDMILVPAGKLWMGCNFDRDLDCDNDELPGHSVEVSAFYIDRIEVRIVDYAPCVTAGHCSDRRLTGYSIEGDNFVVSPRCNWKAANKAKHPVNCVSYPEAERFCEWRGARLPTEAEWERAARGDDKRSYPWGEDPATCLFTVMAEESDQGCGRSGTWPAANKARDKSPYGVLDMAGNVREWVADWYGATYYKTSPAKDPKGPWHGSRRVARGGGWGNTVSRFFRVSGRDNESPMSRNMHLGFRCAKSADASAPTTTTTQGSEGGAAPDAGAQPRE